MTQPADNAPTTTDEGMRRAAQHAAITGHTVGSTDKGAAHCWTCSWGWTHA